MNRFPFFVAGGGGGGGEESEGVMILNDLQRIGLF